jgi:2,4-dichlorophenol 6-monooxygenase
LTGSGKTTVLVVGAGPAGATAALVLARAGVEVIALNKHWGTANTPRAHITNQRTMEIMRDLGLESACLAQSTPAATMSNTIWATSLAGEELARLRSWGTDPRRRADYELASPTLPCDLTQDRLEPILVHAAQQAGARIRFGAELVDFTHGEAGVTATIRDRLTGSESKLEAAYLLGCDGAKSLVAETLGLEFEGERSIATALNVVFRADLSEFVAHRPGGLFWLVPSDPTQLGGNLRMVRPWNEWLAILSYPRGVEVRPDPDEVRNRILGLIGADVPLSIDRIDTWEINRCYATSYGSERVFCAGDAVHCHPPPNGLGSNTAIQDSYNLAWKLALVLRGVAAPRLLDSYDAERQPLGKRAVERAWQSFLEHGGVHFALGSMPGAPAEARTEARELLSAAGSEGELRRQALDAAIALKNYEFNCHGVELNHHYRSGAVLSVSDDEPTYERDEQLYYQASTAPGARLPHTWLERDGELVSTLDLVGQGRFTLVTGIGGEPWQVACRAVADHLGVDLASRLINRRGEMRDVYRDWARLRGIDEDGCLLVRPDAHIAWRQTSRPEDCEAELMKAMRAILGLGKEA